MKNSQLLTGFFWIGLGGFVSISSCKFGLGNFRNPGPGLMPFLLGLLLCGVSLYYLCISVFGKDKVKSSGQAEKSPKKIIIVVVSLVVYALILEKLGYLVSTSILLFIMFWLAGSKKHTAALSSIITTVFSYFFFSYLGVGFPEGILKF